MMSFLGQQPVSSGAPSIIPPPSIPFHVKSQLKLHHGKNHKCRLSDLPSVWLALAGDLRRGGAGSAGCVGAAWARGPSLRSP